MIYIAYSDESYRNERCRSIATITFPKIHLEDINEKISICLSSSNVSEFKWQKLRTAKYLFCASKIVKTTFDILDKYDARIDTIIWDTHDSRHNVVGRDDEANFERMFYHLHNNTFKKRVRNAKWEVYPDENLAIDWDTVATCLESGGRRYDIREYPLIGEFLCSNYYFIQKFEQIQSNLHYCCQMTDLFAGLAVFSKTHYSSYKKWLENRIPGLWKQDITPVTNREEYRYTLLLNFITDCKARKLGVSLDTNKCLFTMKPKNPINFWHYRPQHEHDKAPTE